MSNLKQLWSVSRVVICLVIFCLCAFGFARYAMYRNKHVKPSAEKLIGISNRVVKLLGAQATLPHVADKVTYIYVDRNIVHPRLDAKSVMIFSDAMEHEGWEIGQSGSVSETTLCKNQVIVDVLVPDRESEAWAGSVTVSWGDAYVRCKRDSGQAHIGRRASRIPSYR